MPNFDLTDKGLRCVVGHLGRDPEVRYTQGGKAVAKFSVATNRKDGAGNVTTDWHNVNAWEEQAEAAMQLKKGQVACVIGKESQSEYNGKTYTYLSAWFVGVWVRPPDTRRDSQGHHESLPPKSNQGSAQAPEDDQIPF